MPRIPSPNPDFKQNKVLPTTTPIYRHGLDEQKSIPIPMAFQITSPFDTHRCLLPTALVMHVNPATFGITENKKVERIQTRGGWVEQHWGDDLAEISADGSTGAFMNIYTGLSSVLRQRTIAWDRYRDLHDLFRNNGSVYDPYGNIVLQGNVMLMFDRGTYIGYFTTFETEETDESPFAFHISWSFKVQETIVKIPTFPGLTKNYTTPDFQSKNALQAGPDRGLRVTSSAQGVVNSPLPTPAKK
jgi:hypothetical protein